MDAIAITPAATERQLSADEAQRISLLLDYADFCGMQHFGGDSEPLELWTLRKAIPGHPKGSTVTRATVLHGIETVHA